MSESCKTLTITRRLATGLYQRYFRSPVLDVGSGPPGPKWDWATRVENAGGPALEVLRFDQEHGDAQTLAGIEPGSIPTVYASHVLEHLQHPMIAVSNWLHFCRVGGTVFIAVPHRELYECGKRTLPSYWSREHLHFFLPWRHEPPHTLGLAELLLHDVPTELRDFHPGLEYRLDYIATCDWGYHRPGGGHPAGEYQIEAALVRTA